MEIEIIVEGEGLADVEVIRIPEGSVRREIVAVVASKCGFSTEEGNLFVEDVEEPLNLSSVIHNDIDIAKVHHVHRARTISVSVFYQGSQIEKQFAPSVRVQVVLDWAVGPQGFKIDSAIGPEMELALQGQNEALPKNAHIGRYVRHPKAEIKFNLIRGVVPNGVSL